MRTCCSAKYLLNEELNHLIPREIVEKLILEELAKMGMGRWEGENNNRPILFPGISVES